MTFARVGFQKVESLCQRAGRFSTNAIPPSRFPPPIPSCLSANPARVSQAVVELAILFSIFAARAKDS